MPSLVAELALYFYMLHRALNLHCIELEYEKATKKEIELRTGFAADLLTQDHRCTVVTTGRVSIKQKTSSKDYSEGNGLDYFLLLKKRKSLLLRQSKNQSE